MADVRLRHGWLMIAFLVVMLGGATMIMSDDPARVRVGIAFLLVPLAATAAVLGIFYWKSRREG